MKLWKIAVSDMKKQKGNAIILFLLVAIATLLLYTGISVLSRMNSFLDKKNEEQNGSHCTIICSTGYDESVEKLIYEGNHVEKLEKEECLMSSSFKIRDMELKEESESMTLMMYDMDFDRTISDLHVLDKADTIKVNSIYLPAYLKLSKGYKTGDIMEAESSSKTYQFEIAGFLEDVMMATPSNITAYKCMIPHDLFEQLKEDGKEFYSSRNYSMLLKEGTKYDKYEKALSKKIEKQMCDGKFVKSMSIDFTTMKMGTSMFINILMVIIEMFAVLIVAVSMVVIRFSIVMNIERNITNIGILESLGYTSRQLRASTVLEFVTIGLVGILFGLAGAGAASSVITKIVSQSIGLVWKNSADPVAGVIAAISIIILVALVVFTLGRKYKKITPLMALRSGLHTHNFKKNYFPLHKGRISIQTSMGLKEIFQNKKQNIAIVIIVALLAFTCSTMVSMYYNFVINPKAMIQLVGIEKPDVMLSGYMTDDVKNEEAMHMTDEICSEKQVEKSVNYTSINVNILKGKNEMAVTTDICDDVKKLEVNTVIEGRRPKYNNELNVTVVIAEEFGLELGDSLTVETRGVKKEFIISGITQQITNLGYRLFMTEEGYRQFDEDYSGSIKYLYLDEDVSTDDFIDDMKDKYDLGTVELVNFNDIYDTVMESFSMSVTSLSQLFVGITIFVIVLIIFMVIRMKLNKGRKMYGIYKAIGFTTGQLIWQTVVCFAPVVAFGGLIGVVAGKLFTNRVFTVMMQQMGIKNSNLTVSFTVLGLIFILVTVTAFVASVLSAAGIKRIEPYKMIIET